MLQILIPVYNDWESVSRLLVELDSSLALAGRDAEVILVDDGSSCTGSTLLLGTQYKAIREIQLLKLVANLGHQRAIAVGLSWLAQEASDAPVCILDADGEDNPDHVKDLLAELEQHPETAVVFAQRGKRTESVMVRILYTGYKLLHRILTGFTVDIGNFSVLRRSALQALTAGSSLWNHYPAAVLQSRIPVRKLRKDRGSRYAGQSKMTLHTLIIHGLSAVSVFSDRFGVRVLMGAGLLTFVLCLGAIILMFTTGVSSEMWVLFAALVVLLPVQFGMLSLAFVIFILSNRNSYSFIPRRDYHIFIHSMQTLYPAVRNTDETIS
ncbi:MAG: glycosyltransferase [Bacteroidetes bacterium]|nr:glycosyltransferase [Bacteroidota bacterium]